MKASGVAALLAKPVKQSQLFNTLTAMMGVSLDDNRLAHPQPPPLRQIKSKLPAPIRDRTRILLVEDNVVNQQVALRMIERIGYKAETALNGREALEMLAMARYHIVLMDCQMPEMDGYTATRELRHREGAARHTTVVGVTAHALAGDREDCIKCGMDDYLAKPVTPRDMAEMLDRWVMAVHQANGKAEAASVSAVHSAQSHTEAEDGAGGLPTIDDRVLAQLQEFEQPGEVGFVAKLIKMFVEDLA